VERTKLFSGITRLKKDKALSVGFSYTVHEIIYKLQFIMKS